MQHFIVGLMFVIIIANAGWFVFFIIRQSIKQKLKTGGRIFMI